LAASQSWDGDVARIIPVERDNRPSKGPAIRQEGLHIMRTILLSGFATLALVAAASVPASATGLETGLETDGVSVTHGGGNINTAYGRKCDAQQSIATVGGSVFSFPPHRSRRCSSASTSA
jgi:hypothetical protein